MPIVSPTWFFGFDTIVYFACAVIGFFISSRTSKLYSVSHNRTHRFLFLGFSLLSVAFLILGLTSWYNYSFSKYSIFYFKFCLQTSTNSCTVNLSEAMFDLDDLGNSLFFILSTAAYAFFVMMYFPKKIYFTAFLPLLLSFNQYFYTISIFLLSYVFFSSLFNFLQDKNRYRLLVLLGFIGLTIYEFCLVFPYVSAALYVDYHIFLLFSFISFLTMVTLVQKK